MNKKNRTTRSVLLHNFKWFVQNISALHGINQLASKSGKSLIFWFIMIICNIAVTATFILIAKHKYDDDAIVTKINANCNVSQAPFPAVSICNYNLVSYKESRPIANLLKSHGVPDSDIDGFLHALPYLRDYRVNSTKLGNYTDIMTILKNHYYSMDSIMAEVHQKCENLLLYCEFNRKKRECKNIFRSTKTLLGLCCTFNYAGINDASDNPFTFEDGDFEYFEDDDEDTGPMPRKLVMTTEFGRLSGLYVVYDVDADDYPPYTIAPNFGAKLLVNDPYDFPETTTTYHLATMGESTELKVEPKIFQVDNQLRKVVPSKRKCWFHDEVHLDHTDRYSYETCNTECLMQTYQTYCGCVPYKYPREKLKRVCELEDLNCLNNVTVSISKKEMVCNPLCYVECSDKKYAIAESANTILSEGLPSDVGLQNRTVERLSAVHVYYGQSSVNCYKLMLLIDLNYFIATYGGVFSLSFGASIITVFELLYLITRFVIINAHYFIERLKHKLVVSELSARSHKKTRRSRVRFPDETI